MLNRRLPLSPLYLFLLIFMSACGADVITPPAQTSDRDEAEDAVVSSELMENPTALWVSCPKAQIEVSETMQCTATYFPFDWLPGVDVTATATWGTADSLVATVSTGGLVTGVDLGSTSVHASHQDGWSFKSVQVVQTVGPPDLSVEISGPGYIDTEGAHTYTANVSGEDGPYTYEWYVAWPSQSSDWWALGSASTQDVSVYHGYGNFVLRVTVPAGVYTAEGEIGVQNAIQCGGPIACR